MTFEVAEELRLFADALRAAIRGWEAPREDELGTWQDDRDDALAARVAAAGFADLADPELRGAAVAGGMELGRVVAPLCLIDEPTLGAPLALQGRARHGTGAASLAVPLAGGGLGLGALVSRPVPEPTLDRTGTVRVDVSDVTPLEPDEAHARLAAWSCATLGYLAGLADSALVLAVEHARTREQFGAPLASQPAVQSRLAAAALATDGIALVAWSSAHADAAVPASELTWASGACGEVAATAQQVHGALGFALETGLHRFHRRARSVQSWTSAVCAETR